MHRAVKLPPFVQLLISSVASAAALFATQGLIDNRTEKLVTGMAAILIPLGYLLLVGLHTLAQARVTAARIHAGMPTTTRLTP